VVEPQEGVDALMSVENDGLELDTRILGQDSPKIDLREGDVEFHNHRSPKIQCYIYIPILYNEQFVDQSEILFDTIKNNNSKIFLCKN